MLITEYTSQFKKDLKLAKRRGKNLEKLQIIMKKIEHELTLPLYLKDHGLKGNWVKHRELHVEPDWLLIYKILPKEATVIFVRTGTHSDLFKAS